jgi:hypothetical protein
MRPCQEPDRVDSHFNKHPIIKSEHQTLHSFALRKLIWACFEKVKKDSRTKNLTFNLNNVVHLFLLC